MTFIENNIENFDRDAALLWAEYKAEQADWVTDEDAEATAQIEWEAEQRLAQWDDDPSPYGGTYSED